ncbi:hypothetical protein [cf. Phormidesmis sp. LEGE 11477]|uniref:hypothetical protein n=1 Tax=cf. Phormidesmis sp. LEGE 11477 TaxID=1828680 RepID=UPI0018801FA7|nr:hypothetical protein [cf. Phormidesmis sp. LEGE 11477]MBE9063375.1 hypothetical protein [cf. Phormidesmis sp. LEGE 11477]
MLNVLCASALSRVESRVETDKATDVAIDTEVADAEAVDTEYSRSKVWQERMSRSPLKLTQIYPLSTDGLISTALDERPDSINATAVVVEDRAVPRFSTPPCQRAACLAGVDLAITLKTKTGSTEPEAPSEEAPIEETRSEEALIEAEVFTPTTQLSEKTIPEETVSEETVIEEIASEEVVPKETALEEIALEETVLEASSTSALSSEAIIPAAVAAPVESSDDLGFSLDIARDSAGQSVIAQTNQIPDREPAQVLDDDLGTLRLQQTRSRKDEDLGILRLMQTAQAPPPPPKLPIAFLGGRLGFLDTNNAFRSETAIEDQIYQTGLSLYLFPRISEKTSLYAIAETNIARYEIDYNEIEVQAGLRHRLFRRTFAQVGWRNQRLYTPGYREKLLGVNYLDALVSHRRILSRRAWVDGFYQLRLGFADPAAASRFRQTLITSVNYAPTPQLRTSLLYQLEFDDYLEIDRFDTSQQFLGVVSYNVTPESRLSLFGGARLGRSSASGVDLDDVFYGAGLNVNVPLF